MAIYRKKPIEIEAKQFLNDQSSYELILWINEGQHINNKPFAKWTNDVLIIPTLEGDHTANINDYIIKGIAGEFYPCKPDIFDATYEIINT
jgi:hypothetical protein